MHPSPAESVHAWLPFAQSSEHPGTPPHSCEQDAPAGHQQKGCPGGRAVTPEEGFLHPPPRTAIAAPTIATDASDASDAKRASRDARMVTCSARRPRRRGRGRELLCRGRGHGRASRGGLLRGGRSLLNRGGDRGRCRGGRLGGRDLQVGERPFALEPPQVFVVDHVLAEHLAGEDDLLLQQRVENRSLPASGPGLGGGTITEKLPTAG